MAACLRAKGWDAKAIPGGDFTVKLHGQPEALEKAQTGCRNTLGFVDAGKPTAQQISNYYAAQLKVRECLVGHGFAVSTPPSKQTFIDTFDTTKEWNPYLSESVKKTTSDQWNHINSACPQATL
jgi:hypothetical protein